ncbi:MAG: archease [Proteobacteria bacterium]|nr:MAG: archease [Pseudomonadota bacterium]
MSFEFVEDVTSDLAFVARGPTPDAVFRAAGEALLAATLEEPEALREEVRRDLALAEPDLELLLLHYLNELVYLRDAESLLLRADRLDVAAGADARLAAELVGERIDRTRHRLLAEVKAATAHGLHVGRADDGWEARVTLDV